VSQEQEQQKPKPIPSKVIRYYLDQEGTQLAPTDENGKLKIKFGTVLQGQSKRIRLYAKNLIDFPLELEPLITDENEKDLKITRYPNILRVGEIAPVDIVFSPNMDRLSPLESGWDFRKIILSRV
jgi:hypothetical protein